MTMADTIGEPNLGLRVGRAHTYSIAVRMCRTYTGFGLVNARLGSFQLRVCD